MSDLIERLEEKLKGGKFRMINEKIYNKTKLSSTEIRKYHEYYASQIKKWPIDPKAIIIKKIKESTGLGSDSSANGGGRGEEDSEAPKKSNAVKIGDIGCGNCKIMESCGTAGQGMCAPISVTSYDMYPVNKDVVKADMETIPCDDMEYDIVICCLSMMMSYISNVVLEMNRILKMDGVWMVAEVKSRIPNVTRFISRIEKLGFKLKSIDNENTHFVVFEFSKTATFDRSTVRRLPEIKLNPCCYKKR